MYLSSCMIEQKPTIELQDEYWPHLQGKTSSEML